MITSSALALGMQWPNVTIPSFERRSQASMAVSGGISINLILAIEANDDARASWNAYSDQAIGWLNESHKVANSTQIYPNLPYMMSLNPNWTGPDDDVNPIALPSFGNVTHLVEWQTSPPAVNKEFSAKADWRHIFTPRWEYMVETGRTARSPSFDLNLWTPSSITDPTNFYYQPIYSDFEENKTAVAFVSMAMRWKDHFDNILHEEAKGIIVVLKSTCDDLVSYEVNGAEATYLGEGDLHEHEFDALGVMAGLTLAMNDILEGSTESEKGISCGYSLSVYPSKKLQANYTTDRPWYFAMVVVAIFGFTTLVFVLYDCLVQKRQETVMDSAVKTDAIVSQLFPEQFREQMMANAEQEQSKLTKRTAFRSNNVKTRMSVFMGGDESGMRREEDDFAMSKPVADLFPNVTVLFADIVGFTAWSSVREPSQVFTLLEGIYSAFDKIAKRRNIYKVETVSDDSLERDD